MTPEEAQVINGIGVINYKNVSNMVLVCMLHGMYCLVFLTSIYIYLNKRSKREATINLLCAIMATLVLITMYFIGFMTEIFVLVKYGIILSLPGGVIAQTESANSQSILLVWDVISIWLAYVIYLVADGMIVWRAWAVWMDNRGVKLTLAFLMFADIGVDLAAGVTDTRTRILGGQETQTLDWVNVALSFTINVVATSLIGFQAWIYHESVKKTVSIRKKTRLEEILLLLLESGAIFGIVQLLDIIFSILDSKDTVLPTVDLASQLIGNLYPYAAAFNPVAIYVVVQTQNTYEHSFYLEESHTDTTTIH
ncbi:hypothetical protein BDP27DRAFT_1318752 [Rhodocollybia butyracea]|uniref:Uncharacterized protein n=1 Tax=Rhodocollybia butyracea TaxID=206335 RepID=A0A9P5UBR5_9AGAR|nr:hypothetical protein BDP27DRAFT_1318752 [Rhodocollybia butyracea]